MNDLEERLRAAFDARARAYEPDPHAWARIMERRPRRRPARWLLAALPVALLTVFVPVLLNGGLGRNTAIDPTGIYQHLMKERTPLGKEASVDNPSEGKPLRIWFARGKLGYPEVCYIVERAAGEPYGACVEAVEWRNADAWYVGSTLRDGAGTAMDWGLALQDVGAVAGVTKGGQEFQGTVRSLDGAPYRLWTVTYPSQEPMSKIRISDVQGKGLGWWSRDGLFLPDGQPMSAPMELSQGISVQPYRTKEGTRLTWSRHGAELASQVPSATDQAVTISGRRDMIIGLARKDVARIEVSFGGGSTASVVTRPDPWNLGVTLFAAMSPSDDRAEGRRVTAYDASGKQVWSQDEPARKEPSEPDKVAGEVMNLPGTEGSGRPVRIWFTRRSDGGDGFCYTGGPGPTDQGMTGCFISFAQNSYPFQQATTYLPDPGADIYFGPALADWESVEAVLLDGRRVRASFLRGKGAPYSVWHVSVPRGTEVGGFVVKAKGRPDKQVPNYSKSCAKQAARSEASPQTLPAGITALLVPGCAAFWENGEIVPALPGPLPGARLSDLLDAARPVQWISGETAWYGYATAGTAKVELRMKGGASGTAEAVPDTWGQNVTLFAAPTPKGAPKNRSDIVALTGYDAGGKELWRYELPKRGAPKF
ncbi:hypothetical protein [Nonomuraea jabiensis]|uniref:Uncharacterized protein n=1 Tax=Nonomuraea jabiensis TaxID=882448 RepID=A0A7W9LID0_9ACTN|nr:hypothetical protein [Nonomuraea jabiensis]MBB5784829.1 hypothetical protein [Nonomuraea jabiensis]